MSADVCIFLYPLTSYLFNTVDMRPFNAHQPKIILQSHIGSGVSFLNKTLSSKLFAPSHNAEGTQLLLDFLRGFKYDGESLLLSQRVNSVGRLRNVLLRALKILDDHDDDDPIGHVAGLDEMGLLRGWGKDVAKVRESFQLLLDIIQAPDADTLEKFLARLPLVFKVAILSPHGYFGQTNVLGMPDTGGQVRSSCSDDSTWKEYGSAVKEYSSAKLYGGASAEIPGQVCLSFVRSLHLLMVDR